MAFSYLHGYMPEGSYIMPETEGRGHNMRARGHISHANMKMP